MYHTPGNKFGAAGPLLETSEDVGHSRERSECTERETGKESRNQRNQSQENSINK